MLLSSQDQSENFGQYQITDGKGVAGYAFAVIVFALLYCWNLITKTPQNASLQPIILVVFLVAETITVWRLIVYAKGYVIDFDARTIQLPGGGISPNSFDQFFKAWYLLQYFRRFTIKYDEIRSIRPGYKRSINGQENGKTSVSYKYWLVITGGFGAITLNFTDEAKRDELYATIVANNNMGNPVVIQNRNKVKNSGS